jgi:hypothetical protein
VAVSDVSMEAKISAPYAHARHPVSINSSVARSAATQVTADRVVEALCRRGSGAANGDATRLGQFADLPATLLARVSPTQR